MWVIGPGFFLSVLSLSLCLMGILRLGTGTVDCLLWCRNTVQTRSLDPYLPIPTRFLCFLLCWRAWESQWTNNQRSLGESLDCSWAGSAYCSLFVFTVMGCGDGNHNQRRELRNGIFPVNNKHQTRNGSARVPRWWCGGWWCLCRVQSFTELSPPHTIKILHQGVFFSARLSPLWLKRQGI